MEMLYTKNINAGDEKKLRDLLKREYEENPPHLSSKSLKRNRKERTEATDFIEIIPTFEEGKGNIVYIYADEELVGFIRAKVVEKNKIRKGYICNYYLDEEYKKVYEKPLIKSLTRDFKISLDLDTIDFEIKKTDIKLIGYLIDNGYLPTVALKPTNVIMEKQCTTRGEKYGPKERIRRYFTGR